MGKIKQDVFYKPKLFFTIFSFQNSLSFDEESIKVLTPISSYTEFKIAS